MRVNVNAAMLKHDFVTALAESFVLPMAAPWDAV
jgi:hypothetical protein